MSKYICSILFLFFSVKMYAECKTDIISDSVLGKVYFKVKIDNSNGKAIILDAFTENNSKIKSYKGYPAVKSNLSNGVTLIARNVYELVQNNEIELEKGSIRLTYFNGTTSSILSYTFTGNALDVTNCFYNK